MKKILAVALVVITISSIGFAVPELIEETDMVAAGGTGEIVSEKMIAESEMLPYPYYYNEYPEILVLKGVGVKGDEVVSAVFVAVERTSSGYKDIFLLIDGELYELELEKTKFDSETGTIIADFSGEEDLRLVAKNHRIDYMNVFTVTGQFGEYLLNMRLVGNQPIYGILEEPVLKQLAEKIAE